MNLVSSGRDLYTQYRTTMVRVADIRYAGAVLQWDQETYLPPKGAAYRGQQLATLSEVSHQMFTDTSFGDLLRNLNERDDLEEDEKLNVKLTLEDYSRQQKLSSVFVRQLTEAINKSFHSWIAARKSNQFSLFEDDLSKVVDLKRQEADLLGYEGHIYNALLDEFDKGSTVSQLDVVFKSVEKPLLNLLGEIAKKEQVRSDFLYRHYPKEKQWEFGLKVLRDLHYDFDAGRQDISEHPFTTSFNSQDVRLTTRIDENDLGNMIWSCIHELGHGLYEQGLPIEQYGLPLGEAASLAIHESQSRLWENHVGRSAEFCHRYFPELQRLFPESLNDVTIEAFYRAINLVQPSLIRTEADELTYHFHVKIRYELEKLLIEGSLQCADIPAYWNEQYNRLLGVIVPDDRTGCLQDVHWSHGSFGYFPTYSLGSFYAAQFFSRAVDELKGFDMQEVKTQQLLSWLRSNVHVHGRRYQSAALSRKVSGEDLNIQHFIDYANQKYKQIY